MKSRELKTNWNNAKENLKQEFDGMNEYDTLLMEVKQNKTLTSAQAKLSNTEEEYHENYY